MVLSKKIFPIILLSVLVISCARTSPEPFNTPLTDLEITKARENAHNSVFENVVDSIVKIYVLNMSGNGSGSGWVWDESGHLVTNFHVVRGAIEIVVGFDNGSEYQATLVGFDEDADLAVLKIDTATGKLQAATLGDSSNLKVGQTAIAMGNPFGSDFSMTVGIVSAIGRLIPSGFSNFSIPSVIQTDAAINPGNSGGPLLDIQGHVIGINTQIRSQSGSSSGVGFAVPINLAKRVIPSLIEKGSHEYSLMGIQGIALNRILREGLGVEVDQNGAYITYVSPNTPADQSGLIQDSGNNTFDGDLIIGVDANPVDSMDDLIAYMALNTKPGDSIVLEIIRQGQKSEINLNLGTRS